jgi:hypothetical protein
MLLVLDVGVGVDTTVLYTYISSFWYSFILRLSKLFSFFIRLYDASEMWFELSTSFVTGITDNGIMDNGITDNGIVDNGVFSTHVHL